MDELYDNKQRFLAICRSEIKRAGIDKLLAWLEDTDFYEAPASTKFHDCDRGGLCHHSLKVYDFLTENTIGDFSPESMAIVALFHDLCKVNFYKVDYKNQKNANGVWERVPFYTVDDQLALGHGEASLYVLSTFLTLTHEEAVAIRWHMGGFDKAVQGGELAIGKAFEKSALAVELSIADLRATYENFGG